MRDRGMGNLNMPESKRELELFWNNVSFSTQILIAAG